MDDPGCREKQSRHQLVELLPCDVAFVAAPAKPVLPGLLCKFVYLFDLRVVPGDAEVLVMPLKLLAQRSVLLLELLVAIIPAPYP